MKNLILLVTTFLLTILVPSQQIPFSSKNYDEETLSQPLMEGPHQIELNVIVAGPSGTGKSALINFFGGKDHQGLPPDV